MTEVWAISLHNAQSCVHSYMTRRLAYLSHYRNLEHNTQKKIVYKIIIAFKTVIANQINFLWYNKGSPIFYWTSNYKVFIKVNHCSVDIEWRNILDGFCAFLSTDKPLSSPGGIRLGFQLNIFWKFNRRSVHASKRGTGSKQTFRLSPSRFYCKVIIILAEAGF